MYIFATVIICHDIIVFTHVVILKEKIILIKNTYLKVFSHFVIEPICNDISKVYLTSKQE